MREIYVVGFYVVSSLVVCVCVFVCVQCDGVSPQCPANVLRPSTFVCRAAVGLCDIVERCNGVNATCPNDVVLSSTFVCRASQGACDVDERCDGRTGQCPVDAFASSSLVCRAPKSECDAVERCTGNSAACPPDALRPEGSLCNDNDVCTLDLCDSGRSCVNPPIEGCCTTDADCNDGDACTLDSCDTAANRCVNQVDVDCGENLTGSFAVNEYGYASVCNWGGYAWTYAGPAAAGVNGTVSAIASSGNLCYSGVVAAQENYGGIAMLGFNINQVDGQAAENTTLGGAGINLSLVNEKASALRIQIQSAPAADGSINTWCVEVVGSGGFYPWTQFNTACWAPEEGVIYNGEPVNVVALTVSGNNVEDQQFAFCLNKITPSADVCVGPPSNPVDPNSSAGGGNGAIGLGDEVIGDGVPGGDPVLGGGEGMAGETGAPVNADPGLTVPPAASGSNGSSSGGCSFEASRGSSGRSSSGRGLTLPLGLLLAVVALSRRGTRRA